MAVIFDAPMTLEVVNCHLVSKNDHKNKIKIRRMRRVDLHARR